MSTVTQTNSSDRASTRTDVLIVGGGPVGLCAAILLAEHGVRSIVLEKHLAPYTLPRAVHLDGEVFRILQAAGVAPQFLAMSRPACGLRLVDRSMRVIAQFERVLCDEAGIPQANMFNQPELEQVLRERAAALPLVTMRLGVEFESATEHRDVVTVQARSVHDGARLEFECAYLLGADGANSRVRDTIGTTITDLGFDQRWLVIDVDTPSDLGGWAGVDQVFDGERAGTYMHVNGVRHRWEFQLRPDETPADFATVAQLLPLISPWLTGVDDDGITIVRSAEYEFHARVADRWRRGRTFILGDAAHLTPPFIGQGLGAGLRDAHNLSWKLATALATGSDRILDSYQRERKPHATIMIRRAVLIGLAMTSTSVVGRFIRAAVLPLMPMLPGLGRFATSTATPSLRRGALTRRSFAGRLRGGLIPTTALELSTGAEHTLVVSSSAPPFDTAELDADALRIAPDPVTASSDAGLRGYPLVLVRPDGIVAAAARTPRAFRRRVRRFVSAAQGGSSRSGARAHPEAHAVGPTGTSTLANAEGGPMGSRLEKKRGTLR